MVSETTATGEDIYLQLFAFLKTNCKLSHLPEMQLWRYIRYIGKRSSSGICNVKLTRVSMYCLAEPRLRWHLG